MTLFTQSIENESLSTILSHFGMSAGVIVGKTATKKSELGKASTNPCSEAKRVFSNPLSAQRPNSLVLYSQETTTPEVVT